MARHQRRPGETVAAERARLKRQDAGRKPTTTGRRRPTLPSQASPRARAAVAKTRRVTTPVIRPRPTASTNIRQRVPGRRRPTTGRRRRPSRLG